ncbi:hypothetical protein ACB092_09G181800 [Castanea dentata]
MFQPKRKHYLSSEEHIPCDVVFDILTRLPLKSLIRFRCVSNSWYSTITSRMFFTTHLNAVLLSNNNNSPNGFLLHMTRKELCTFVYNSDRTLTEVSRFRNPFYDHERTLTEVSRFPICYFSLFDYCNGVFLFYNYAGTICLWNPSIQKLKMIAASANHFPNCYITLGLAYHSANNDFKILLIAVAYGGIDREQAPYR